MVASTYRRLRIHLREFGEGDPVVLLHSAGTGASQWRGVWERLSSSYRVMAPNLSGYGRTPPAEPGQPPLAAAVDVVAEAAAFAGGAIHLVGHSLGALIAAHAACRQNLEIRSLILIEPVIVGVLHDPDEAYDEQSQAALQEIGGMIDAFQAAMARQDPAAAMRAFTEYWSGPGAWDDIPAAARLPFFARATQMASDVDVAWSDRTGRTALSSVELPSLVVTAEHTTPAARFMAKQVAGSIPGAEIRVVPGAGHMAPMTHPGTISRLIGEYLATV